MRGCELIGRPTKPKFLLEAGELRALFEGPAKQQWDPLRGRWLDTVCSCTATAATTVPAVDTHGRTTAALEDELFEQMGPRWEVVMDEVRPISDGRPLSFFMATRVG